MKPKPVLWIPANAPTRNPKYWYNPNSLCRTCEYQFLQEPFCYTIKQFGNVTHCEGYELETEIDPEKLFPSYTEVNRPDLRRQLGRDDNEVS